MWGQPGPEVGWEALGAVRVGRSSWEVAGEVGFDVALAKVVLAAELADDARHAVAVGGVDEVRGGVAAVVVVNEVGRVLAERSSAR